jgi:protein-disulfide isomerase
MQKEALMKDWANGSLSAGLVRKTIAIGIVSLSAVASACAKDSAAKENAPASSAEADTALPSVLATVGNDKITMADVQARSGDELTRIETQYLQTRSTIIDRALKDILRERVIDAEAAKQGKSYEQLVADEAGIGINPTDEDIAKWYQENTARTGGRPLESIKAQIAELLRNERRTAAEAQLQARLTKERKVEVKFQPYRLTFNNGNAPSLGPENAPVTLVEFSDFQCPFCNRFAPTLKQVREKYGDKVRVVYRQYPIPSLHPFAFMAAEASLCANEQGKFWPLHDAMFANQTKLAVADIKKKAVELGMDQKKFDSCVDSGRFVEQVQSDMAAGVKVGITGTPAVFVNGIELKGGAVAFDVVAAAIDQELSRIAAIN